jgi:hypothetical protein
VFVHMRVVALRRVCVPRVYTVCAHARASVQASLLMHTGRFVHQALTEVNRTRTRAQVLSVEDHQSRVDVFGMTCGVSKMLCSDVFAQTDCGTDWRRHGAQACTHAHMHARTLARTHTYALTYTHIHAHTQTHSYSEHEEQAHTLALDTQYTHRL